MHRRPCRLRSQRNHFSQAIILEETEALIKIIKMKNGLKFLSISLLLITTSFIMLDAQEMDHIYLKSGSVIRGQILEIEPVDHVKIQDMCGNIWYYKIAEVEKITSEPFDAPGLSKNRDGFQTGFVNMTSIGFLAGSANNTQVAPFSMVMVNGWRSQVGFFAGIGLGIEFLNTNYFPFFLDLRYDLTGKDVVPYLVVKGGYSLPMTPGYTEYDTEYAYQGGALAAGGVGLKIRTRQHFAWDVELMYRYQKTSRTEHYGWNNQEYLYTDIYNRIEIRLGFYID